MYDFSDKTILITGGSMGIGLALAKECIQEWVGHILLVSRFEKNLKKAKGELEKLWARKVSFFVADLSVSTERKKLYETIKNQNITVDILVNNAGFGRMIDFVSGDYKEFENMIDLNVKGVVELSYLFLQDMRARKSGAIINVASVAGFQSLPFFNIYAATKAFVLSFTEALYGEYSADGIWFLALCPAETNTNWLVRAGAKITKSDKYDSPENVAKVAIKSLKKWKMTVIPKFSSAVFHTFIIRLLPRKFLVKWVAKRYFYYKK